MIKENKYNINILCDDPKIFIIDNFITENECDHLMSIGKSYLMNSMVSDNSGGFISKGRTSKTSWIDLDKDNITNEISKNISDLVNISIENSEKFQLVYYNINNEYRQHYDSWDHDGCEKTLRCMKYGGPRILTALLYLNNVEEGGTTYFTKLDIDIKPEKGRLLIFENVYKNSINKHLLSEHAGKPIIKGEKYIVNLWFRQFNRSKLYSETNPDYYNNIKGLNIQEKSIEKRHNMIIDYNNILTIEDCKNIINKCNFSNDSKYPGCWLKKKDFLFLINKISILIDIKSSYFENINVIKYKPNQVHGPFLDAYDLEKNKKYIEKLGQRIKTISICLSNNIIYEFRKLSIIKNCTYGTLINYNNNIYGANVRNDLMTHIIKNIDKDNGYLLNLYVREYDTNKKTNLINILEKDNIMNNTMNNTINNEMDIFEKVLIMFKNNEINNNWNGYYTFNYLFKGDFEYFKKCILKFINLRENKKGLNYEHLNTNFNFNEFNPLIINDVISNELLNMLQSYYKKTINDKVWGLGDRQSKRFKARNEPMSRFLHFEILPLIQKITGKRLKPSYTYLSSYTKESDLPPHTDNPDCQYTVSFLINYDVEWAIYYHKVKQPVKYKGRSNFLPELNECLELYCNIGSLIIFTGTDHIHFRNKFLGNFYDVLLLHYIENE